MNKKEKYKKIIPQEDHIPQFYFPCSSSIEVSQTKGINQVTIYGVQNYFPQSGTSVTEDNFTDITTGLFKLPVYLNNALFSSIDVTLKGFVTLTEVMDFYNSSIKPTEKKKNKKKGIALENSFSNCSFDLDFFFDILRNNSKKNYISQSNLISLVESVISYNPKLKSLLSRYGGKVVKEKYIKVVVTRIIYALGGMRNNRIYYEEFIKNGGKDLISVLFFLKDFSNINLEVRFFSFEHFFVIFQNFNNLEKKGFISRKRLSKNFENISKLAIKNIFENSNEKVKYTGLSNYMNFEEFIWFILSVNDKSSYRSNQYWYYLIDNQQVGRITYYDFLKFFNEEEKQKTIRKYCKLYRDEFLSTENVFSQMENMVSPKVKNCFSLKEIVKSGLGDLFFSIFIDFNRYMNFDNSYYLENKKRNYMSPWNKFAKNEFQKLTKDEFNDRIKQLGTFLLIAFQVCIFFFILVLVTDWILKKFDTFMSNDSLNLDVSDFGELSGET